MSKHGTIRRYSLEIEKIKANNYPSFQEIRDYLKGHGFEISNRTLQRDFEQIRYEFDVEIKYDRLRNGYFIDYENSVNIDSFFNFLDVVNNAELLTESLMESKDSLKYISFENDGGMKGIEKLKPLLSAIKNNRKISFSHYNFHTEKMRKYSLKPYLLKEFQNRWYVVGKIGNLQEFRIFGIDRIENLEVKAVTFERDNKFNVAEIFENSIGLFDIGNQPQQVVLSFTPLQGKYIKTLPLHTSQNILTDNDEECRISLHIVPNFELCQEILKHGDAVKVISPPFLVNKIKSVLQKALDKY